MLRQVKWNKLLLDVAGGALAVGAVYLAWRKINDDLAHLIEAPVEDGLHYIGTHVPTMNAETWLVFQTRLAQYARRYPQAETLYFFAADVYRARDEVDHILNHNIPEAVNIITGILPQKSDRQRAAFASVLNSRAQHDLKAQAVLGHLRQLGWGKQA